MNELTEKYVDEVCKPSGGRGTCAFLAMHEGWYCAKQTAVETLIRQRLKEDSMSAKGNNCSGPPLFEKR